MSDFVFVFVNFFFKEKSHSATLPKDDKQNLLSGEGRGAGLGDEVSAF